MLNESVLVGVRVELAFSRRYPLYRAEGGLIGREREEGKAVDKSSFTIFGASPLPDQFVTTLLGEVLFQINMLRARVDGMESAEDSGLVKIKYSIEETTGEFELRYEPGASPGSLGMLHVTASARRAS